MLTRAAALALCLPALVHGAPHRRLGAGHSHGGAGTPVCACEAAETEHPFTMSCSDTLGFAAAKTTLDTCTASNAGCKDQPVDSSGVMPCQQAFFKLYFAHGWCPDGTLNTTHETMLHTWEPFCKACEVYMPHNPSWPACVQPACATAKAAGSAAETAFTTLNTTCTAGGSCCQGSVTQSAWRTMQAYHDMCEHDDVATYIEQGYHDFDAACESSSCNAQAVGYDGTKCPPPPPPEEDDCDDHGHDHRRRLGDDECPHSHTWLWVLLVVCVLLGGGVAAAYFMKVGPFAEKEDSSEDSESG
jgi:hypothetical protein